MTIDRGYLGKEHKTTECHLQLSPTTTPSMFSSYGEKKKKTEDESTTIIQVKE